MPDGAFPHPATEVSCPSSVRMAAERDEAALYDLLMALDLDNGFGVPLNPEKIRAQIEKGTRRQGGIIGVIDGPDGRIAGSIGLFMSQPWYSDQWHLSELWLFVRPEQRRSGYFDDLFRFANWCRQEMERGSGQRWLVLTSVSSPRRLPAKLRLWARYATQVGGLFVMGGR